MRSKPETPDATALRSSPSRPPDAGYRGLLVLAALLFVAIFTVRLASDDVRAGTALLFVVPIALIAYAHGLRAGLGAAAVAFSLFLAWVVIATPATSAGAYFTRAVAFVVTGAGIGLLSDRWRSAYALLAHRESLFRDLVDSVPDGLFIVDAAGRVVLVNTQGELLLGYTSAELAGRAVETLVPPRLRARHIKERGRYERQPSRRQMGSRSELVALHRDGRELPVEIMIGPLAGAREPLFAASVRDVSERRRAEDELRRWGDVFATAGWGIVVESADMRTLDLINPAFARMHGCEVEELAGRPLLDVFAPAARAAALAAMQEARELGECSFESEHLRADGSAFPVAVHVTVVKDDEGAALYRVVHVEDISARRAAEHAQRTAEAHFRSAFEDAPIGVALVSLDPDSRERFIEVNRALCAITGRTPEELAQMRLRAVFRTRDAAVEELLEVLLTGDTLELQLLPQDQDDVARWAAVRASRPQAESRFAIVQIQDISERKRFEGQLQYLADHDPLTGLFNRRRFEEEIAHQAAYNRRYGVSGAVLVIDLDQFKYVNDTLGHAAGDELLRRVATILSSRIRNTDTLARLGGDEFGLLMPRAEGDEPKRLAEGLLERLRERPIEVGDGGRARVTASIGIAPLVASTDADAAESIVHADIAMYDAKESGRDQAATASTVADSKHRMTARLRWGDRIRNAMEEDRFVLLAQPIRALQRPQPARHELLLRMRDEGGDLIPPSAFLYVAEQFGQVQAIDRWVVTQALDLVAADARAGRDAVLQLNISGTSLSDPTVIEWIESELGRSGADPSKLVFEVTETAAIVHIARAKEFAARLAAAGCAFALDDFGAGFGSFYYLKHLPFDYLKIDGGFVEHIATSRSDQLTVQAIVQIARGLGKQTIAEFVTDAPTEALVRRLGVDFAQGYAVGRPRPLVAGDDQLAAPAPPSANP